MSSVLDEKLPQDWRLARFDEIMRRVDRKFTIDDSATYNCVGVRWYGKGTFVREQRLGLKIARKQQWRIKSGDVVYNKLFAWKGSFAIADDSVDGCIVSDKFPTYQIDPDEVDRRFLGFYFQTSELAQQAQRLSKGAAAISKLTLNPPQFWDLRMPLPPLTEQRRIAARIERLADKIAEARSVRQRAIKETESLVSNDLASVFAELVAKHGDRPLADLINEARYGTSVRCEFERANGSVPVLRIPNVASEHINFEAVKYGLLSEAELLRTLLHAGDLLVVRTNGSLDLVGRCAVVPELAEPTAFASYLIRIRCSEEVTPEYLQLMLKHLRIDGQLFDLARTTAGQYNVSLGRLRSARIPVPNTEEQRRVVSHLDQFQAKADVLIRLQLETVAELDALLPSILDKAFKRDL